MEGKIPPRHTIVLITLNNLASAYLDTGRWAAAEATAQYLPSAAQQEDPDGWWKFQTMSQLGAALAGLGRHPEAEPLLVRGYEGLKTREAKIPSLRKRHLPEAAARIVPFYESWGKPEKAAEWRTRLATEKIEPKTQFPFRGHPMTGSRELQVAEEAARTGGAIASRFFREEFAVYTKSSAAGKVEYNLVSEADLEAETAIVAVIRRAFPDHAVLGEELHGGDGVSETVLNSKHLWIVDPIDGTNNFVHRIPHFGVSVAYYHEGQPACGVMGNPIHDDWFTAGAARALFTTASVRRSSTTCASRRLSSASATITIEAP